MIRRYCEKCKKEIMYDKKYTITYHNKRRFCSRDCAGLVKSKKVIICSICSTSFEVKYSSNRKYCGKECTKKAQESKRVFNCLYCGDEVKNSQNGKFCNSDCWKKYLKENPQKERLNKVCKTCGKNYEVHLYRRDSNFCSKECFYKTNHITITCLNCKKSISGAKWELENRKFCNSICQRSYAETHTKSISKWEIEIFNYLQTINSDIKHGKSVKISGKLYFVDLLYNDRVIELNGDYWHCNPFIYDSNYYHKQLKMYAYCVWKKDQEKYNNLLKAGYISYTIWEWEWTNKKEEVLEKCKLFLT